MKILTCNIRCSVAEDGVNNWPNRRELCVSVIRSQSADLIGFQEMWSDQFDYITAALPEYSAYATVDEPDGSNPVNAIFFRTDRFAVVSSGGFWLSEEPHVSGSSSWGSAYIRLANWVRLRDHIAGREMRFVNTHLDNESQAARENQARMLCEDADAYPVDYPQLLTGDLNCDAGNNAIRAIESGGWTDTYRSVHGGEDPGHTYHEFQGEYHPPEMGKMDWIFARGEFEVTGAEVIRDSVDGRFPSDHYFVSAEVT